MAIETPSPAKRAQPGSTNTGGLDLEDLRRLWLKPLWLVLSEAMTAEPKTDIVPHLWRWSDVRPRILEAGRRISAQEAGAARADVPQPGLERRGGRHPDAVHGDPAHHAGRDRAHPSAHAVGAARGGRGQRRVHHRLGRKDADATRRLRHHPQLGVARSRQRDGRADAVARRTRHALHPGAQRDVLRRVWRWHEIQPVVKELDDSQRRYNRGLRPIQRRVQRQLLARPQLPLRGCA